MELLQLSQRNKLTWLTFISILYSEKFFIGAKHPALRVCQCNTVEVQRILQKIDASKSSGEDKIPARQLKETAHLSAVPLSVLYNLSFMKSQVPTLWKHPSITPIHKKGEREPVEHYSGISLLSITGKCQERLV